jgi:hypothetical protein
MYFLFMRKHERQNGEHKRQNEERECQILVVVWIFLYVCMFFLCIFKELTE